MMAAQLLSAGGYSDRRVGLGQAVGQAMMAGRSAQNEDLQSALQAQLIKSQIARNTKGDQTSAQRDYEYAKENGYTGSFEEWKRVAMQQSAGPATIQEYNLYSQQSTESGQKPKPFMEWMRERASYNVGAPYTPGEMAGGKGAFSRVTGQFTPQTTLEQEAGAAGELANAGAAGKATGEATGAQAAKLPAEASMEYVVGQFGNQIEETAQGGPLGIKGRAGYIYDYGDATRFDNLREQLSTELRTVFRIPGEGTLSDREQAQYGLQLPNRDYSPAVNKAILRDVQERTRLRLQTPVEPAASRKPDNKPTNDPLGIR
jgi:hypothetical protein